MLVKAERHDFLDEHTRRRLDEHEDRIARLEGTVRELTERKDPEALITVGEAATEKHVSPAAVYKC